MKLRSRYRIRVLTDPARRRADRRSAALLAIACGIVVTLTALPVAAAAPASLNVTLNTVTQQVKSVTLSTAGVTYSNCTGGSSSGNNLGFPNGDCITPAPGVTVTNGTAPATIVVNGTDMVPSDNGPHWTLCGQPTPGPQCTVGGLVSPAQNQYYETLSAANAYNNSGGVGFLQLSNNSFCDSIFNNSCANSAPGATKTEFLSVEGPTTSADPSTSWATSVTWTAT